MQTQVINVLLILSAIVSLLAAFYVYNSDKALTIKNYLALALLSGSGWALSIYLGVLSEIGWIANLAFIFAIFLAYSIFQVVVKFNVEINSQTKLLQKILLFITVIFGIITQIPNFLIKSFEVVDHRYIVVTNPGPVYYPYLIFILIMIFIIIITFIRTYRLESSRIKKSQLIYLSTGLGIGIILSALFNLILPLLNMFNFNNLGPISILFISAAMAYVSTRHYLYDRKVVFSELWTFVLIIMLINWLVITFSIANLILFILVISICGLFLKSVVSEAEKNLALVKANKALEKDKEKLQEIDRMKDEFLMMATHELNTPISIMRGKLMMILDENFGGFNQTQKEYLRPVLDNSKRLIKLFKQVLDVTGIDQNKIQLNTIDTNLTQFFDDSVNKVQQNLKLKHDMQYSNKIPKKVILKIDQNKIYQAIETLIENAIIFSPNDKPISVIAECDDNKILFKVKDQGKGISKEDQKHMFEKFFQAGRFNSASPTEQQGAGLGLYIAKKLVELHHGEMNFISEIEKGSEFSFSLPLS